MHSSTDTLNTQQHEESANTMEEDATFPDEQHMSLLDKLRFRLKLKKTRFSEKVAELSFSQWMYLAAIVAFVITVDNTDGTDSAFIAGIIAGIGLLRELAHLFMRIWSNVLGKGVLFVIYAATANIALAVSALKINTISGVEPTVFIFTMGFATLLMLPFWLILASMIFLGTAFLLANLWFLANILLRIVGVKVPIHWEDKSFVIITLIARIFLIPTLIYALGTMINPYLKQFDMFETPSLEINAFRTEPDSDPILEVTNPTERPREKFKEELAAALADAESEINKELSPEERKALDSLLSRIDSQYVSAMPSDESATEQVNTVESEQNQETAQVSATNINEAQENALTSQPDNVETPVNPDTTEEAEQANELHTLDLAIANFIYRFETYPYSACAKEDNQRVLTINENMVFVAERDESEALGIKFSVIECVTRDTPHKKRDLNNQQEDTNAE